MRPGTSGPGTQSARSPHDSPPSARRREEIISIDYLLQSRNLVWMVGSAKKYYAAAVLAAWLIIVAFFMILNRTLDLEVFFVLALIGLLVVAVLIDGAFSRPRYMRYIGYLIAAGVALFAYIVAEKILEILAA
jgi:hypothetical protein